jgi:hypothetical protein
VAPAGGLAEVAGVTPGSIAVEPTVAGILRSVDELRVADRWMSVVRGAQGLDPGAVFDAWVDAHLEAYSEVDEARD